MTRDKFVITKIDAVIGPLINVQKINRFSLVVQQRTLSSRTRKMTQDETKNKGNPNKYGIVEILLS